MRETWIGPTSRGAGVTALSAFFERRRRSTAIFAPASARANMARLSLLSITMTCAAGCFDSPPQYTDPTRIPPQIFTNSVVPPPTSLFVTTDSPIQFTIPFRADDAVQQLEAAFVLDIGTSNSSLQDPVADVPQDALKRPFAEQEKDRKLDYTWDWNPKKVAGCHTMTVIITDPSNIRGAVTRDDLQVARLTWFMWLQDPDTDETKLVSCLQASELGQATAP
jgi:hypothetical protein